MTGRLSAQVLPDTLVVPSARTAAIYPAMNCDCNSTEASDSDYRQCIARAKQYHSPYQCVPHLLEDDSIETSQSDLAEVTSLRRLSEGTTEYTGITSKLSRNCTNKETNDVPSDVSEQDSASVQTYHMCSTDTQEDNSNNSCDHSESDTGMFHLLPIELIQFVLSFLPKKDLCSLSLVCKQFRTHVNDPINWKKLNFSTSITHYRVTLPIWEKSIHRSPLLKDLSCHGMARVHLNVMELLAGHCPLLEKLDFGFVKKLSLDHFILLAKNFLKLRYLNIEGCREVTDKFVEILCEEGALPVLEEINLSHCHVENDSTISLLASTKPNLKSINIDGMPWLSDSAVIALCTVRGTQLSNLIIDGAELTDNSIVAIAEYCKNLLVLSISFADAMTNVSLSYIKNIGTLHTLVIRKGLYFSHLAIGDMFRFGKLSNLRHLELSECTEICDEEVKAIVQRCGSGLQKLALNWCWNITDDGLEQIVFRCSNMERLELQGLDKIRGHALAKIPECQKKLTFLDLRQCNVIIDELLYLIVREQNDLMIMNYYGEEIQFCDGKVVAVY